MLTREESLGLIAELRRVRLERHELRAALEPLQVRLSQHHDTPRSDEWFYDVPEICDGGPCESAADALRSAVQHLRRRAIDQRQEMDDMAQAYQELRAKLDPAEGSNGLAPWRRAWMARRLLEPEDLVRERSTLLVLCYLHNIFL